MIWILTNTSFVQVGEDLATDVALFALGQYNGCFGNGRLLSNENGGIAQYREWKVQAKGGRLAATRAVLGRHDSHS
ncbi:hypothetical protein Acr_07g0012250 [Actinidia rufa]|uniref:Uncharacterized protein n=1 Tax=Actinidia rufa TaxID=165716 RepID=A0A7J0EYH3_9ERIC|nr:hypothetical protein Acr_07g0012250 [Actinidia rufa]